MVFTMMHLKKMFSRSIKKLMIKRNLRSIAMLGWLLLFCNITTSSQVLIESIAAIVGNEVIYLSDIENMVTEARRSGNRKPVDELRCSVLEQMLVSKLFLDQARLDSIIVTEDAVEGNLNMKMNDAIRQVGSEKALEGYFKKSLVEIRRDIRKQMLEQETISEVQAKIAEKITITPVALKRFYASIPKDSLPVIPAKVEISVLQLDPPSSDENKLAAREKLLDYRSQILAGKSFSVLAMLYSEDTESAKSGGEIGFLTRGELEKEYADAAFSLTKNTVSKIVETKYGFHIIQLIDRKGDMVNTRHILIRPKLKPEDQVKAISKLDSIANEIRKGNTTFENAAKQFSSHKDSRINGGKLVSANPSERITWFPLEELNPDMYAKVRILKVGEISDPFRTTDENANDVFRIVKLDNELPAHRADLKNDYQSLYNVALMKERTKTYDTWIKKKIEITYIKISEEFKSCNFLAKGWIK
jgi:peptidyl-prolyl cis-trans isomerase SurA